MPEMGTKTKYPFLPMNRHIAECRWSLGVSDRNSRAGSSGQVLGGGALCSGPRVFLLHQRCHALLGVLTVCYFYDNYVLQVYRRLMFDVAIYETMTPFHTFHLKVLKRMTHFLL